MNNEFWEWFNTYAAPKIDEGGVIRSNTFRKAFEHLDKFNNPIIIETGCVHQADADGNLCWSGHGCSTVLFDKYVTFNGGSFFSVEIDTARVDKAKNLVSDNSNINCGDSVTFLKDFTASPHLVYLDSYDLHWQSEAQVHAYNELRAILPKMTRDTLLLVDDSPFAINDSGEYKVSGKGRLIAEYAHELSVPMAFTEYQTAWLGFPGGDNCNKNAGLDLLLRAIGNNLSDSLLLKASILLNAGRYEEVEVLCDKVIQRNEFLGVALSLLATVQSKYGNHEVAVEIYKKALNYTGSVSDIYYNLAMSLFSIGLYKDGWRFLYASRLEKSAIAAIHTPVERFSKPLFMMQPSPTTVHIHLEAGAGDRIACLRFVPLLLEKGYKVRLETDSYLFKLISDSFKGIEIVDMATDYPGILGIKDDFDYHQPITNLPFVFGCDINSIPWNGPYIKADKALVKKYEPHKGKIGIAWSASSMNPLKTSYVHRKSLPFSMLKTLIELDHRSFVSLQVGEASDCDGIIDCPLSDEYPSWDETAALLENLDLIITVDTAVAHLAGAMGKEVWLMMRSDPVGWQIPCERPNSPWNDKSPWYPSMYIFRQKKHGDWLSVVARVISALKLRMNNQRPVMIRNA